MNLILWIVQVLLGLAFIFAGSFKAFQYERAKTQMSWIPDVSRGLVSFIGLAELLGGLGLILPALTGRLTWLTPLAGAALALVMLLAAGFHLQRKENAPVVPNLVLFALTAFVAYGRWVLAPL